MAPIKEPTDIEKINMVKGMLQRLSTYDNYVAPRADLQSPTFRRSFRLPGSKQRDIIGDSNGKSQKIFMSPDLGRRRIPAKHVTGIFGERPKSPKRQIMIRTKSLTGSEDINSTVLPNAIVRSDSVKRSDNKVSKKISMFNRVLRNNNGLNNNSNDINNGDKVQCKTVDNSTVNNRTMKKLRKDIKKNILDARIKKTAVIENNIIKEKSLYGDDRISEEELLLIRKRKLIGRSNSATTPLRQLVMTREVARSRRSLSFSLIPEEDNLSLLEAVERRLNLSKETNLCHTDL